MTEANSEAREWMLTWTRSGIRPPDMFHPLADEYADIDGLERALDIPVGTPVLINPDGGCDIAMSEFFDPLISIDCGHRRRSPMRLI